MRFDPRHPYVRTQVEKSFLKNEGDVYPFQSRNRLLRPIGVFQQLSCTHAWEGGGANEQPQTRPVSLGVLCVAMATCWFVCECTRMDEV